jgi:predicted esterase YcpF (UPF0227 family)
MLIYIHGFNSSPASHKAALLRQRLTALGLESQFSCPELPHQPAAALELLQSEVMWYPRDRITLIGSSLGGYYATWLAEKFGVRAVLVNPATAPYADMRAYLGPQRNLYTGATYTLTEQHLRELEALRAVPTRLERYYLMVTTGDEVLDYRTAVRMYTGAKQLIVQGSDHGFADFGEHLDSVLQFAGIITAH